MYGPTHCEGIGMSDGEVMERLWSYLRRFSRMTKEMWPAHRVDILSHALLYYGSRNYVSGSHEDELLNVCSTQHIATLLVSRWKKATEMNSISKQTLQYLCESLSGILCDPCSGGVFSRMVVCSTCDRCHDRRLVERRGRSH